MIVRHCGKYRVGADITLKDHQLNQLKSAFDATLLHGDNEKMDVLGGRTPITRMDLADIGPVVVKPYTRGGIIRCINHRTYLKTGSTRCRKEYALLDRLGHLGIRVPAPVAFAYTGIIFYHAWLVSRELRDTLPLAGLSEIDPDRCLRAMRDLQPQLSVLVANRILHVDLHPGNVLVDAAGRAYLIDFDKARTWFGGLDRLRRRYRERWQRAVAKHGLPRMLNALPV